MSSVICKFSLVETTRIGLYAPVVDENGTKNWVPIEGVRVKLSPVQGEPFGSATPSGNMEMVIANTAASQVFLSSPIGQEYEVLLTSVEK